MKNTAEHSFPTELEKAKGLEVARMVESIFKQVPLEVAAHLVDSNVVLTLAGLKGQTEFFIDIPNAADDVKIKAAMNGVGQKLNAFNSDIYADTEGRIFNAASDQRRTWPVSIYNLQALEGATANTKLKGIPIFKKSSGMNGLKQWAENAYGNFDSDDLDSEIVVGVIKGYPDQAIVDFIDYLKTNRKKKVVDSKIPYTGFYSEAQPNYDFYPEHINDPGIAKNIAQSGEILKAFYESPWHKQVASKLSFKKTPRYE